MLDPTTRLHEETNPKVGFEPLPGHGIETPRGPYQRDLLLTEVLRVPQRRVDTKRVRESVLAEERCVCPGVGKRCVPNSRTYRRRRVQYRRILKRAGATFESGERPPPEEVGEIEVPPIGPLQV